MSDEFVETKPLPSIGDLLSRSLSLYQTRLVSYIGLFLWSLLIFAIPFAFVIGMAVAGPLFFKELKNVIVPGAAVLSGVIFLWYFARIGQAYMILTVNPSLTAKGALAQSKDRLGSFLWTGFLCSIIIMGGYFLLIIPGILFTLWFFAALMVFVAERESGMNALLKSKFYVEGRAGAVFLRLLVISVIGMALQLVPIVGQLLALFYMPFQFIAWYLLYDDLKKTKDSDLFFPSGGGGFVVVGLLGFVLFPVIMAGGVLFAVAKSVPGFSISDTLRQAKSGQLSLKSFAPLMKMKGMKGSGKSFNMESLPAQEDVAGNIKTLKESPETIKRQMAASRLGRSGNPEALAALRGALKSDAEWSVRSAAATQLGESKDKESVDALIQALRSDEQTFVRNNSAQALGKIGDVRAVDALIQALETDKSIFVRRDSALALGELRDARAMPALKKALNDQEMLQTGKGDGTWIKEPAVAKAAQEALNKLGSAPVSAAVPAPNEPAPVASTVPAPTKPAVAAPTRPIPAAAPKKLVKAKPSPKTATLVAMLRDSDWEIRKNAAQSLGRVGSKNDIPYLKPLLQDKNPQVRAAAQQAIGKLQTK